MARLRATILGCGSSGGVPRVGGHWGACDPANPKNRRSRCSLLVELLDGERATRVLVDTAPDMRAQLLAAGVGVLDAAVYTHAHADHVHGIDDLRMVVFNRGSRLPVWADADTTNALITRFGYAFVQPPGSAYPSILELRAIEGAFEVDGEAGPLPFVPVPVHHGQSHALGFRMHGLVYMPDVSEIPDATWPLLVGLDYWILDALRYRPHPTHAHVERSLRWIARAAPRRAVLTNLHNDLDHEVLSRETPANVAVAHDGMVLELELLILDVLVVVLPVFLVAALGWLAVRCDVFPAAAIDGLMSFALRIAVPCLLFRAISRLDLGAAFDPRLLASFYIGAATAFALGILGARYLFGRRPGEAVAIGFSALFSNLVLLGLPIMERAYGREALAPTFAIVSIHAPFCYLLGITAMEFARSDGRSLLGTVQAVVSAMFRNAMMIGLALGFAVNLSGIVIPGPVQSSIDMIAEAALPVALFGLGGVLTRYGLRASVLEAGMVTGLSLLVHPAIAFALSVWVFDLPEGFVRSAVVAAAMAPGVNTYVFATQYNRGRAQAASAVLLATGVSVLTVSMWLVVLGGVR